MNLGKIRWSCVYSIGLAQGRGKRYMKWWETVEWLNNWWPLEKLVKVSLIKSIGLCLWHINITITIP
jgi:hypothetical protein